MLIQEWGNATWFLFHTLSYKLKDNETQHAPILLKKFVYICNNLPCPICRDDATGMLKTSMITLVKTKYDLIRFMWQFHNLVNKKLNKPIMSYEEHIDKYSQANTLKIVKYYQRILSKPSNNSKAMLDSFKRKDNVDDTINYIQENLHRFNL